MTGEDKTSKKANITNGAEVVFLYVALYLATTFTVNCFFFLPLAAFIFFFLYCLAILLTGEDGNSDLIVKKETLNISDNVPCLRRPKRLVKFKGIDIDSDSDDDKVEVIRPSKLHLLRFDTTDTESRLSTYSTASIATTDDFLPQSREINLERRILKTRSIPNLCLESPLERIKVNLAFLKEQLYLNKTFVDTIDQIIIDLKSPESLTVKRRVNEKQITIDKTWSQCIIEPFKPYTSGKVDSLFSAKSFREIKTLRSEYGKKRTHSSESFDGSIISRKRTNSDSAPTAINFTFLPSLVVGKELNNWNLDVVELSKENGGKPLTWLLHHIAAKRDWYAKFKISKKCFLNFCEAVESGYFTDNSYHNNCHAADVVNSIYYLFLRVDFAKKFDELAFFTGIIAAAVHDIKHPGKNSRFLIHTRDDLAKRYNDNSILENMHLFETFEILEREECNIVSEFSEENYRRFRKLLISSVMSTDLSNHLETMKNIKINEETLFADAFENDHEELILQIALKIADIGHSSKCRKLHEAWSKKMEEEMFRQGDAERSLGVKISQHMDRNIPNLPKNQVGFFEFIAVPMFRSIADLAHCPPKFLPLYSQVLKNKEEWDKGVALKQ